jgi:glutamine amidotransferase
MIKIIDYGVGNVEAFITVFKNLGFNAERVNNFKSLAGATRLILPGVGNFDYAMQKLNDSGLRSKLEELVLEKKIPIMGVCVGMQILADCSEEGILPGLGWIPGKVKSFNSTLQLSRLPLPHMGWNELNILNKSKIFSRGFQDTSYFYFLHSYYFEAKNKEDIIATANYGIDFHAVLSHGHIHGVQCHPEKSHGWGNQILKNFVEL